MKGDGMTGRTFYYNPLYDFRFLHSKFFSSSWSSGGDGVGVFFVTNESKCHCSFWKSHFFYLPTRGVLSPVNQKTCYEFKKHIVVRFFKISARSHNFWNHIFSRISLREMIDISRAEGADMKLAFFIILSTTRIQFLFKYGLTTFL